MNNTLADAGGMQIYLSVSEFKIESYFMVISLVGISYMSCAIWKRC
jgi:hypothetical protein